METVVYKCMYQICLLCIPYWLWRFIKQALLHMLNEVVMVYKSNFHLIEYVICAYNKETGPSASCRRWQPSVKGCSCSPGCPTD